MPAAATATPAAAAAAPKEEEAAKKPAEEEAAKDGATNMDTEGDAFYQSSASSLATGKIQPSNTPTTARSHRACNPLALALTIFSASSPPSPPTVLPSCAVLLQVLSWSRAFR